jgi:hypothetical protein
MVTQPIAPVDELGWGLFRAAAALAVKWLKSASSTEAAC